MARRIDLIVERQFRPFGECRVKDRGVRLGQEQPGRIALRVAHDFASGRLRRVLGIADDTQSRAVEDGAIVEMQNENRRVGRRGVQLVDGRQALLGELMLGEAADHAHPLRRRRDRDLALEHRHGVGEACHTIPAQLHVEVQAAANDVQVIVDQPRQHQPALEIDDLCLWPHHGRDFVVLAYSSEFAILNGDGGSRGIGAVQRRKQASMQNEFRIMSVHDRSSTPFF